MKKENIMNSLEQLIDSSFKEIHTFIETDIEFLKIDLKSKILFIASDGSDEDYKTQYEILILETYLEYALCYFQLVQWFLDRFTSSETTSKEKYELLHSEFIKPYLIKDSLKTSKQESNSTEDIQKQN